MLIGLIGIIIYKALKICKNRNINNYLELTKNLVGENKIINYTISNIINIFLLISYIVMVAGVGSFFKQELGIPFFYGSALMAIISFLIFKRDISGIQKTNLILVPFLIIAIYILGFKTEKINLYEITTVTSNWWLLKSILYASYNSIILIPIILVFGNKIKEKSQIIFISISTFLIMISMSYIIYIAMQSNYNEVIDIQMPIIYLARKYGKVYQYTYSIVVLIAILTTAISSGYGFLNNCTSTKRQYLMMSIIISLLAVAVSSIGFDKLLDLLYPILGFLGLIQIFFILKT